MNERYSRFIQVFQITIIDFIFDSLLSIATNCQLMYKMLHISYRKNRFKVRSVRGSAFRKKHKLD